MLLNANVKCEFMRKRQNISNFMQMTKYSCLGRLKSRYFERYFKHGVITTVKISLDIGFVIDFLVTTLIYAVL